ncbi:MAG TPA: hypothetical protein ENN69_03430 [Spirochaetia bacterium]|nr:hypothetical protein [Spirochaetia bacterium]
MLIHILVTRFRGYDMCTLYFDDRAGGPEDENQFVKYEKEFVSNRGYLAKHPEDTFGQTYFGYFIFPEFSAEEIYHLYKIKCEAKPNINTRYNIFFTKRYMHLEEMIKTFNRPLETFIEEKHKLLHYSHRLEYFERSIQIIRDMQTAIYETEHNLAALELELHRRFVEKQSER